MNFNLKHLAFVFATAVLASCGAGEGNGTNSSANGVTFVLKGIRSNDGITYADRIASESEDYIETLDIYMFDYATDGSGTLVHVWDFTGSDLTPVGANHSVSLGPLSKEIYGDGLKVYYFVANGAYTTDFNASTGNTTELAFRNSLTTALDYSQDEYIEPPLLFTGKSPAMGLIGSASVELARRVARFDIVNDYHDVLEITAIAVKGANSDGYVFSNNQGSQTVDKSAEDFDVDLGSGLSYAKKPNIAGTASEWIAESVFYLYPTEVPANSTITISGSFEGDDFVYHVNTPTVIRPNYRYKLIATKGALLTFELVLLDWEEGGEIELGFMEEIEMSGISVSQGGGSFDAQTLVFDAVMGEVNELSFTATTTSQLGLMGEAVTDELHGTTITFVPSPVTGDATYANNGKTYKQACKLVVDATAGTEVFTGVEQVIYDITSPDTNKTIVINLTTP